VQTTRICAVERCTHWLSRRRASYRQW